MAGAKTIQVYVCLERWSDELKDYEYKLIVRNKRVVRETPTAYYIRNFLFKGKLWRLSKQELEANSFVARKHGLPHYRRSLLTKYLTGKVELGSPDDRIFFSFGEDNLIREHIEKLKREEEAERERKNEEARQAFESTIRDKMVEIIAYQLLGVTPSANGDELKQAYRAKVKRHHPDRGGDPDVFAAIKLCYEELRKERRSVPQNPEQ